MDSRGRSQVYPDFKPHLQQTNPPNPNAFSHFPNLIAPHPTVHPSEFPPY